MSYSLYEEDAPAVDGIERDIIEAVAADEPWALVERFSDLERVSGTADEREAAAYIADRLDENGIAHEIYEPSLYLSTPDGASIGTDDGWVSETAKTVSFSGSDTVEGDLVYVENDEEMDSIASMLSVDLTGASEDLEGKVVLAESIIPISAIEELDRRGAAAFVGIHPHEREPHEGIVTPVWGGAPPLSEAERVPELPVANVSRTEGEALIEKARDGATITVETETTTGWVDCPLVVADVAGDADPDSDEFVLVHGHYDSWHVGITDNATGDAALLETARVLDEHSDGLDRNVRIAWWPGHSTGRYAGSTWYADEFAQDLADNCVAHVNVDSPGVAEATEFDRAKWTSAVGSVADGAIRDVSGKAAEEKRVSRAGDYSFSNLGIPGMSLQSSIPAEIRERRGYHPVGGSGGHADAWHLTTDTIEKADPEVLVRDVQVVAVAVARLAGDAVPLDVAETARKHRAIVEEYDAETEFDLESVVAELDALEAEAGKAVASSGPPSEALIDVAQTLTRLNYTSEGRFEQDPAEARPPYPSLEPVCRLAELEGDDRRFLEVELLRNRNAVVAALREARELLSAA
jgi:Iap family predicted aminopeptidase